MYTVVNEKYDAPQALRVLSHPGILLKRPIGLPESQEIATMNTNVRSEIVIRRDHGEVDG